MNYSGIFLPVAILILSFVMKLTIGRKVKLPKAIKALCSLPVDILFLAISFISAYIIADNANKDVGFDYFITFIILGFGVVLLWRWSTSIYEKNEKKIWLLLLAINLFITTICLVISINFLIDINQDLLKNNQPENTENHGTTN